VRVTVDTNILVRAAVRDDERQADLAAALLKEAEVIAVPLPCLCEFVWVLRRVYGFGNDDIAAAIEALLGVGNVAVDRSAADAGLAMLKAGGDFADGLIAHEGGWLGADTFVSFDKKAVALITQQGGRATLLG
jgi:predicted nucleic-acid-binding protein